jgi:DNA-binding CsgD family transcriptional regulator
MARGIEGIAARAGENGLLERSSEVAEIDALVASAQAGSGRCLLFEGGPGLGKSRLVSTARERARAAGLRVVQARGDELEQGFSFGVALQLFEPVLAAARPDARDELMVGSAGLAAPVFERPGAPGGGGGLDERRSFSVVHGLYWLAANLADREPLLIAVDDAHWADDLSLRYLRYLLQRLDELPIALVAAARPDAGDLVGRIAGHPLTAVSRLAPLSAAAVTRLVREALGDGADDELCSGCAAAAGGNPLHVRELIRSLREGSGGNVLAERLAPDAAARAVTARMAGLGSEAQRLAAAASVLGDGAPLALVAAVAGVDEDEAPAHADALAAAGILAPGVPIAFTHPTVRESVHESIEPARRAHAHSRAARLLQGSGRDPERVASHLLRGDALGEAWVTAALRTAATAARRRGALDASVRYLRAALGDDVSTPEGRAVLLELARSEAYAGEPTAVERAQAAVDAVSGARERAEAALELGLALADGGRHAESAAVLSRGLAELGDEDAPVRATLRAARAAIGGLDQVAAAPGGLDTILDRTARGAATPGERLTLAHGAFAKALAGESLEDARRLAFGALDAADSDAAGATEMSALMLAATTLIVTGDLGPAERALSAAIDGAHVRGSVTAFATASHVRAHTFFRLGRLDEAIADAESVLDAARYGWEPALPAAHAVLVNSLVERGQLDAAELAADIPGGEERWADSFTWNDYLDARGRLALARGEPEAALADFVACGDRLEAIGASHAAVVPWRAGAARAALALGDRRQAAALADRDLERARAFPAPWALGVALHTAGVVAGGDRGVDLLREALDAFASCGAQLELAHVNASLGAALLGEGHRLAAREPLREAVALAHGCGAAALEAEAHERLIAAGARPRRPDVSGRDALTPRELRIAGLAAEGMSNREIAEALFITRKTVETHLAHVYRKLGVASRAALPTALGAR